MSNSIGFEAGVLIAKNSSEFESYAINKELNYGFFDDVSEKITPRKNLYEKVLEKQKERAREYVKDNVNGAYAIVSYQNQENGLSTDYYFNAESVSYSITNINGKIIEGFLEKEIAEATIQEGAK